MVDIVTGERSMAHPLLSDVPRKAMVILLGSLLFSTLAPTMSARAQDVDPLGVYHTYDELTAHLVKLEKDNPDLVRLESIGTTYEDRQIWAVELSDHPGTEEPDEPDVLIMGGHHAREAISVEVPLGILDALVEGYHYDGTIRGLVDRMHIWFVPLVNPDGHAYFETGEDWRKNRRPTIDGNIGVDINRNYGHRWGEEADHDPADGSYCGPEAFSEVESRAIRSLVENNSFELSLSYHSQGGYILHPWGNSLDNISELDPRLHDIATSMVAWMPNEYKVAYALDYYPVSGDSDDWLYAVHGVYAYTIELAPNHMPKDDLVPGIIDHNLDAAMAGMVDILTDGEGQVGLSLVRTGVVNGTKEGLTKEMLKVDFEVRNYHDEFKEIAFVVSMGSSTGAVHRSEVIVGMDRNSRSLSGHGIYPTIAGWYFFNVSLEDPDLIPEDDTIQMSAHIQDRPYTSNRCDVDIGADLGPSSSTGIPTLVVGSEVHQYLDLYVVNMDDTSIFLEVGTLSVPDGYDLHYRTGFPDVGPGEEGDITVGIRAYDDGRPGTWSYLVVLIRVSGDRCHSDILYPIRLVTPPRHDLTLEREGGSIGQGSSKIWTMEFVNDGNVDEVVNLTTSDPRTVEPLYPKVTVPSKTTIRVPFLVQGRTCDKDWLWGWMSCPVKVWATNDELDDVEGVFKVAIIEKEEGATPVGMGPLLLALVGASLIKMITRPRMPYHR